MVLFLKLLLAHLLGDFCFQSDKWIEDKKRHTWKSRKLGYHLLVHVVLLSIIFKFQFLNYWLAFLMIICSHYLIDVLKIKLEQNTNKKLLWFFLDQTAHLLILIAVVYHYESFSWSMNMWIEEHLLLITCLLLVTFVASIVIKIIISPWNPQLGEIPDDSLLKAGRFIGLLERAFVFVFIITNHWEAVGFLLAAKSIFRFGDLRESKDRKLTEYVLIGTLLSFGIAILIGMLFVNLNH